jgi:hypothetical protein
MMRTNIFDFIGLIFSLIEISFVLRYFVPEIPPMVFSAQFSAIHIFAEYKSYEFTKGK